MQISKNKVASFHYKLFEGDTLIESTNKEDQMLYLHGAGGLLVGLENALEGKQSGDVVDVTLTPEQAYGQHHEGPLERISIKHLHPKRKPRVDDIFQVNTKDGMREVAIKKVGKFNVDVDTNHPLAGKTLRFNIIVGEVREATEDELSHGHAHGAGGHHH